MFHLVLVIVTIVTLMTPVTADENTPKSFDGNSYVYYRFTKKGDTNKDRVTVTFRTTEASGVLVYSCGRLQGDFLLMELKRGKIVYTGNLGSTSTHSGIHRIVSDIQYNDGDWHDVTLSRENGTHVYLKVDGVTKSHVSDVGYEQLNLNDLYIGGIGDKVRNSTDCYDVRHTVNFKGCLVKARFNSNSLLYGALSNFDDDFKIHGRLGTCPQSDENTAIFGLPSRHSRLVVSRSPHSITQQDKLDLLIELRTFEPSGSIATHNCTGGNIEMRLVEGKVKVVVSFLGYSDVIPDVHVVAATSLNDGNWHTVRLVWSRTHETVTLSVDGKATVRSMKGYLKLGGKYSLGKFMNKISFGKTLTDTSSLPMCFRKIVIDGERIGFASKRITQRHHVTEGCPIRDLCFPNPCLHAGKCSQSGERYTCDCRDTHYAGPRCGVCRFKRTCAELKASGVTSSGKYHLCPNNERVFEAHCDITTGETVIKHDMKNRTKVAAGRGVDSMKLHDVTYAYKIALDAIADLIDVSESCRQHVRFDCYNSTLLNGVRRKEYDDFVGVRWASRESRLQNFWGGSDPQQRSCQCGVEGNCATSADGSPNYCNCDAMLPKWSRDEGYITQDYLLPITQVQVNMRAKMNSDSKLSVGYLRCQGLNASMMVTPEPTIEAVVTEGKDLFPRLILPDNDIFPEDRFNDNNGTGLPPYVQEVSNVEGESLGSLFSKPWLITIVGIGVLLCLLLVFLMFVLYRQPVGELFYKCLSGGDKKPRIEIEEYNRYSTATEDQSDWDIHNLSVTFPTSTPAPSYGPTDDEESVSGMRCRTMEDVRQKQRRLKKLSAWGSHTASAPTVIGSSASLQFKNENTEMGNHEKEEESSEEPTLLSHIDKKLSASSDTAFSTTATDGEADSVVGSECSRKSSVKSSLKESEHSLCSDSNHASSTCSGKTKRDYFHIPVGGSANKYTEPMKHYVIPGSYAPPQPPQRAMLRYTPQQHSMDYNNPHNPHHMPPPRGCHMKPKHMVHPRRPEYLAYATIQERCEDTSDLEDNSCYYGNARNSDGFYDGNEPDQEASPSSETRLLMDDMNIRDEQERKADEQIKLLKRQVIEKATTN